MFLEMMKSERRHAALGIPAYVFAIFEGDGGAGAGAGAGAGTGGGNDGGAGSGAGSGQAGAGSGAGTGSGSGSGSGRGRFEPKSDDPAELRRALEDANRTIESAQSHITELNKENEKHRTRFRETKTELDGVRSMVDATNQRVIRSDARDALRDAGAINARIVDLFIADNAEKIKIDSKTGEPTGIAENLEAWKTANPDFFKPAAAGASGAAAGGQQQGGKPNSSGSAGTQGGAGNQPANGGLPDFTKLNPKERAAAMASYKRSLRGAPGG